MYGKKTHKFSLLILALIFLPACGSSERDATPLMDTFAVTGKIIMNDKVPDYPVTIIFNTVDGAETKSFPLKSSSTDGTFKGKILPGKYKVTFEMRHSSMSLGGGERKITDLLEGEYQDVSESKFDVEVKEVTGEDVNDIGEFKLTSTVEIPEKLKGGGKIKFK